MEAHEYPEAAMFSMMMLSPPLRAQVDAELSNLADELIDLIQRHGMSVTQAAEAKGLATRAARSLLAGRIHLPARPGPSSSDHPPPLHPILRKAIAQLYEDAHLDLEEIAAQTRRGVEAVRRALKKEGVNLRGRGRPRKRET